MKFKLDTKIDLIDCNIEYKKPLFFMGSCFSDEIGFKFKNAGFETHCNYSGTIYHPIPLAKSIENIIFNTHIYPKIKHWASIYRVLLYVALTFLVEFISGGMLKIILGKCPWEYTEGVHILGIIRIDYFIFWVFFMYIIEYIYLKLTKIHF